MAVASIFVFVSTLLLLLHRASMNPSDCWNDDKLKAMSAKEGDEHDKNLSKFNMMVKCLMQEKSPGSVSGNIDWNQFNNIAQSGRFPKKNNNNNNNQIPPQQPNYPNMDNNRRNRNRGGNDDYYDNRQPPKDWVRPGSDNNNNRKKDWSGGGGGSRNTQMESQPRPGVHPEDWNEKSAEDPIDDRRDQRYNSDRINTPLWGQPSDHGYNPKKEGGRKRGNNRQNRNKNRDNKRIEDSIRDNSPLDMLNHANNPNVNNNNLRGPDGRLLNKGPDDRNSDPSWVDGGMNGRPYEDGNPFISADFGGDANLSLHRKYGYAVMAMSVVVLAVLMVSTIFCCNSSNSTMSQPAVAGIAQLDNYSLYSYKQGMVLPATTDTLRSGTIRSSMRTDTLRSSATNQQFRSSPQYRVSDIDPDFARRYKDENHY
ncbi:uncharacterized protein [Lepeophtheirus salmonis]|uniref:uncharacterized protein n=1 Tax=Lepeophtheirus salmonis TaxID=72036 RepID=UPI001AE67043|nr:GATA zinc finger domain-containing protein 14-like [Lepeophtheirus salmonis]